MKKNTPQKDLCRKKGFDTPNSFDLGRFSRRNFYPQKKENPKKRVNPIWAAKP